MANPLCRMSWIKPRTRLILRSSVKTAGIFSSSVSYSFFDSGNVGGSSTAIGESFGSFVIHPLS
jgi:hypothetical protein